MENNILKKNIMRRVYTVYIIKSVARPLIIELAILALLIGCTAFFVSLQNIIANAFSMHDVRAFVTFIVSAFMNTQVVVQTICIGLVVVTVAMLFNFIRRIRRATLYSYKF